MFDVSMSLFHHFSAADLEEEEDDDEEIADSNEMVKETVYEREETTEELGQVSPSRTPEFWVVLFILCVCVSVRACVRACVRVR